MALTGAFGLYLVWVLVTYLLEGRIQTFLRPEAMGARLFYALVANIIIGIGGSALVIRFLSRGGTISTEQAGFRGFGHAATDGQIARWFTKPRRYATSVSRPH